ncbi:MAG TPA: ABC transporter ATP-binding protein [Chthoniobacteraceae bacterium]|jgi:putative ABC transport system ATP-binding protein
MIRISHVHRRYSPTVAALDDISLEIAEHEFVAITGPSGCGKSTLLHLLGGLDQPDSGEIHVGPIPLHSASEAQLTEYRRREIGIVFQFFHLLPTMTVLENVCLPLLLQGEPVKEVRNRAAELVDVVGLSDRAGHFPHQLSGGQLQRTAIARALVHRPRILLADEPTGNLDSTNAAHVMELLQKIASQRATTLLIVTHSEDVARLADRRIQLRDGRIFVPHP